MNLESFFSQPNIIDLSFFNFRNAITAAFFADTDLKVLRTNENFLSFFPILGNVENLHFLDILGQLGVTPEEIENFETKLKQDRHVLIPEIFVTQNGEKRVFSLLATYTEDPNFSYLNGIQGQFVDRTKEYELSVERDRLIDERIKDQEKIVEKSTRLEELATRLAKYLSPQIYQSIFSNENNGANNLTRKNLTIFFSDIVGFTEISDGMEPEKLAFVINTYLSEMSKIALEYGGTIDKFIGDAILVFFGDPESDGEAEDALKCANMALRMRERVAELQDLWVEKGISKPIQVRMGINTGYCTVGNFGSEQRLEYTILGSPVNLTARLQSATKPDTILISETSYTLLKNHGEFEKASSITPKGFSRPVDTYKLINVKGRRSTNGALMTRTGEFVKVSILNGENITGAIQELKRIQEEFQHQNDFPDSQAP